MKLSDIVGFVIATAAGLIGVAYWLIKVIVQHRLAAALDTQKAQFATELERTKNAFAHELETRRAALQAELLDQRVALEGATKRQVDSYLGEIAAQRQYEFDARKRLYLAVGPLRFQLLLACRDVEGRVESYGFRERYDMDIREYYGASTLFRLLRPLGVAELIEREIAYSDFSIDKDAIDCLRLKRALVRALSGEEIVGSHPAVDWRNQTEHAFAHAVIANGTGLIHEVDNKPARILRFDEFTKLLEQYPNHFNPMALLLSEFTLDRKPLMWLRLVATGYCCNEFVNKAGAPLGFERRTFLLRELIEMTGDAYIAERVDEYEQRITALASLPL